MKKQLMKSAAVLSLLAVLTLAPVYAQYQTEVIVTIPFSFTVGEKTLPAGQYRIKPASNAGLRSRLLIQSRDGKSSVIASTDVLQKKTIESKAKLMFNRYGDQYFLSQVHMPETEYARTLPKGKIEVKLAASGEGHKIVALIAR
jgi:hypothetical protein